MKWYVKYQGGGTFKEAFNRARESRQKYFEWNGKLFNSQISKSDKDWDSFNNNLGELETGRMGDTFGWDPAKSNRAFVRSEREAYNIETGAPGTNMSASGKTYTSSPQRQEQYHTDGNEKTILRERAGYWGRVPEGGERENPLAGRITVGPPKDFDYNNWWANTGLKLADIVPVNQTDFAPVANSGRQGGGKRVPGKSQKSYSRSELRNRYAQAYMQKLKEANLDAYRKFYNEKTGKWKSDPMFERNFEKWISNNNLRRNGLGFGNLYLLVQ